MAATQEISVIEAGYIPAARCGRTEVMAEPVALGRDVLSLVPAPVRDSEPARYPLAVVTVAHGAAALAAGNAAAEQVLLQPSPIEPAARDRMPAAPSLQADGPLSHSAERGSVYPLRVQVIYTGAAGPELPYPGMVRNLMSLFFDLQPDQEPVRPAVPAV